MNMKRLLQIFIKALPWILLALIIMLIATYMWQRRKFKRLILSS